MENKFKFLVKHSLKKKLKNKWFIVVNVILAIVLIGLVNIDSIVKMFGGNFSSDIKIRIVDNSSYYENIKEGLESIKPLITDSSLKIIKENNLSKAKKKIKGTDDILLVIEPDNDNIFKAEFITDSYVDLVKYQAISSILTSVKRNIYLSQSNIDKNELDKINSNVVIKRSFIDKDKSNNEENTKMILSTLSLIIVLPCFMLIVFLVQMIGAEINEEKSTRGMEIIIGNVSAKAHFFSKVLASNIFVLLQGALIIIYGLIGFVVRKLTTKAGSLSMVKGALDSASVSDLLETFKTSNLLDKIGYIIPLLILLIVLSFLAYSLLAGILASVTTNMENFQQLQTPLMIINVVGYYLIIMSSAFPGSIFIKIMSIIPLISVTVAPSMLISGEIGIGIIIIAILLLVLLDYLLIKYGLRVYKAGILNYSENDLFKKMLKAVKEK